MRPAPLQDLRWQDPFPGTDPEGYAEWRKYHQERKHLWAPFENEIFLQIENGDTRLSAKKAAEDVRKKYGKVNDRGAWFLDNTMVKWYALAFCRFYPQYRHLFEFRLQQKEAA